MTDDAVESILKIHKKYRSQNNICGYAFLRAFPDGKVNGKKFDVDEKIGSYMKVEFHSDFINRVAKHVFAVYLFEGALRQIVQNIVFDYSIYEGEWYWPLVNIAVALIAMAGCMSIDVLAQWMLKPFRKAALKMLGDIINISQKIFICY